VNGGRARRTKVGRSLLAGSVVLLVLQFAWGFSMSWSFNNPGLSIHMLHLTPCVLLLASLYLLFSPGPVVSSRSLPVRLLIYLVTSYVAAGGLFILALLGTLAVGGSEPVARLFDHLGWIPGVITVVLFPIMARALR
jgi:hypothetical protein